ncbi:uncharacterized protein FIESC28_07667 [Fusarium coffeatum]|uniref:Protein kinase domain-containing protein n=1 Tax=Fusarium coffeatum TaxID=231269 RepID=A0A366RBA9_9HYPO|nr:uncharacterized protein FIESC28_07667 [Fusarium coffeatum]RBR14431.1 hypothetical protein FIESC28_07667 [Fusarium coffeatum]
MSNPNIRPLAPAYNRLDPGFRPAASPNMSPSWNYSHLPLPFLKIVDVNEQWNGNVFFCHEMIVCIDNEHFFICEIYSQMGNGFNPCTVNLQQVDMRPRGPDLIPQEFTRFAIGFFKVQPHEIFSHPVIPVQHYQPVFTPSLTIAPLPVQSYCYMKMPCLSGYNQLSDKTVIAKSVTDEAIIGEVLLKNPHPNLAKYWGCVVQQGRITSLVYGRYAITLLDRFQSKVPMNIVKVMQEITAGITHLHNLGYAHNDLNPSNIMMDANDSAVIIDFDSCAVEGGELRKLGTPGWSKNAGDMKVSARENDLYGLEKIREWLNQELGVGDQASFNPET